MDNPLLPKCDEGEAEKAWRERRARFLEDLKANNDPLVFAQEYCAEFVDWSGVAFFSREKLLVDDQPVPPPSRCDAVFAVNSSLGFTMLVFQSTIAAHTPSVKLATGSRSSFP